MQNDARKFIVILEQDDRGIFAAHCPAVKCSSQGFDRAEALEMIAECIQTMLDEYEGNKESNPSLVSLPFAENPQLISDEVREILEYRVEYESPMTLEVVQIVVPAQVPV